MPEYDKNNLYFAAKPANDAAAILVGKSNAWYDNITTNGYLDKLRMMWAAYHGVYYTGFNDSHSINFSGEQGELSNIAVNHLGNIAEHMINMITATRPAMRARASNRDYKSVAQTKLANNLLDYYLREKRLENYLKEAVRSAVVLGSGYVKLEWNSTSGEVYDYNQELGIEEREGDIEFSNMSPFDIVFDPNREDNKHDWILCRTYKNKYDLSAKYPEFKQAIENLESKAELTRFFLSSPYFDQTDLVPVYEFYHKRSEALPEGRYILFLTSDIVLIDSVMPYRNLPVYRIAPRNIMGTPYGYTPLFDILPIQDGINSLYSTILTNNAAFGVQNLLVPKGADVSLAELSGGLNIVEANMQFGEIKPLQLTATAPETFKFLEQLEQVIQTISGINSVTRGDPDPNLRSANAMALVQSMALQFMSGLQQSYVSLIEDLGTGIINVLRDFASVPRIAMINGKDNRVYMKEFTGDDLSTVNRVVVDIGNPLASTTAGKVEMAEQLLQMGLIKTPEQYFSVIENGRLDEMTDDQLNQNYLVKQENEKLMDGGPVIAIRTDEHQMHIKEHAAILSNPDLRIDAPELVERVLGHIQEHIDLLRTTDPEMLKILSQQPLSPPGGSPANQPNNQPPASSMQGPIPEQMGGAPMPTAMQQQGQVDGNLAQPATPPPPFENLPTDPAKSNMGQ